MKNTLPAAHRPDIQGLRALAVSLVLIFHFLPWLLPGGYIGVDVFFVISGFLITSHLIREIRLTGRVKLSTFWARRARRLLPASLLVLITCTVIVLTVLPTLGRLKELKNIGFAAVFGVNWVFAYDAVDYLGGDSSGSIVQHYWSLAVEEQFYLFWPVLLFLVAFFATRKRRDMPSTWRSTKPYLIVILFVFVGSLLYSIYETGYSQPVAYFITPTRVWELAAGGLIAFLPTPSRFAGSESSISGTKGSLGVFSHAVFALVSWGAWGTIIVCALFFDAATPFPGSLALIPVAATAYLLWQPPPLQRWSPQRLSEMKPIQWLGDISYPLYLWHWPLLVVFIALRQTTPGLTGFITLVLASLLLAWATKRWVEDPVRFRITSFSKPRVILPVAAAGIALALSSALVPSAVIHGQYQANYALFEQLDPVDQSCLGALALTNNCENPYARTDTVNPAAAREDNYISRGIRDCPQRPNLSGDLEIDCLLNDPNDPDRNVVLIGDSFTAQIADTLGTVAERLGWRLHERTLTGCTGFLTDTDASENYALRYCVDWANRNYQEVLEDPTVDTVIMSARSLDSNSSQAPVARERIKSFVDAGKLVIVVHSPPGFNLDPPVCVEETSGDDPCTQTDEGRNDWLVQAADDTGAHLLELRPLLCPDGVCHTVIGGTVAYLDQHHFTQSFVRTLRPWFETSLRELTTK